MQTKRIAQITAIIGTVGLLMGCSSGNEGLVIYPTADPTATKTPTRTQSPTPSATQSSTPAPSKSASSSPNKAPGSGSTNQPKPTTKPMVKTTVIVIGADDLRIENLSGKVLQKFPYNTKEAPVAAIDALTKIYGKAPKVSYTPPATCGGDTNSYTWDNMTIYFITPTKDPKQVEIFFANTHTPNQNYERVVQAPNGAQVGMSYSKYIAKNPKLPHQESKVENTEYQQAVAELSYNSNADDPESASGVLYGGENDKIKFITAPGSLYGDC
jgi:hypothetical protein